MLYALQFHGLTVLSFWPLILEESALLCLGQLAADKLVDTLCLSQVIKLISQVIADFADGEIGQQARAYDTKLTIAEYMDKSFYKTATLIAASCKGAAVFSDCGVDVKNSMFEFGRHLGLAFQVVDDILDFTQTSAQLGKPQVSHC